MANVKWWIKSKQQARSEGFKKKTHYETTLDQILNEWNGEDLKFVKVTLGHASLEFLLYNSETYTRNSRIYGGTVILDMFQILVNKSNIESQSFFEVMNEVPNITYEDMVKMENWLFKDEMENLLNTLAKHVGYLPEYTIADKILA